jgi:plastocyanin
MIPNVHCDAGGMDVPDEQVLATDDGGLQNVLVWLKDGPNVVVAKDLAMLDQIGCRFVPRVVAVQTGQPLRVKSSDATLHNVHGQCSENSPFNFGLSQGAQRDVTFTAPERFMVKCDVHPWMAGYIGVFDHPFFAVTPSGGTFRLGGVPAGAYTLAAWHEKYGTQEKQVTVNDDASVTVDFVYRTVK